MTKKKSIEVSGLVQAEPAEVYRMFTNSTHLREWLADTALAKAHEGGPLYLEWNDGNAATGSFTMLEPDKKVSFTWRGSGEDDYTDVEVELTPSGAGTEVVVRHFGFGKGKKWKRARKVAHKAWTSSLENLASVISTGEDLRFTRRPMLGVMVEREVDDERAAELGIPIPHGVELSGVVPAMGAEAVGLKAHDVIVALAGTDVLGWTSLTAALQPHQAGDKVPVVFYRDGAEEKVEMELSARPMPDIPTTASELAGFLRKMYAEFDAELAACFEGISEDVAGRKPAADEWSAKEVVAHLLDEEGDSHAEIIDLVKGGERFSDASFSNSDLRVAVTAWSYPTVAEMLEALRHTEEQTVSIVEQLPPEFVARKSSFWRLAYNFTQTPDHNNEHLEQIRAALAVT